MLYHYIYITILIILALMLFPCLIRAIKGPRIADRLVSVNMMGTMVMVMIAVLALMLDEGYLVDVCLVYAMISGGSGQSIYRYLRRNPPEGRTGGKRHR